MGGKGSGTGSPNWFRCWRGRRESRQYRGSHSVKLTGRTKRHRPARAVGSRNTFTSYEYECECGYIGWSSHMDLARMAGDEAQLRKRGMAG